MRAYLHRKYRFAASHRLHCDALSEDQNRKVYGKCNNPHGHGHNYVVEVTVGGTPDPVTGMLADLASLDSTVEREVLSRYDVANLNRQPEFMHTVPTTENLTIEIERRLREVMPAGLLESVRIEETGNNTFAYGNQKRG